MIQYKEELIKELLNNLTFLDESKKVKLYDIAKILKDNNLDFLHQINRTIGVKANNCRDTNLNLEYKRVKDAHQIIYKDNVLEFSEKEIKEVIFYLIDILQETYPLGTVVNLKKDYMKKLLNNQEVEEATVVIINRFLFYNKAKTYFDYTGVVYPLGLAGKNATINFTDGLIDKVVQKGYSDDKEEAYVYLMKKELIVDKGMHSFALANEESRKIFGELVKESQNGRN